MRGLRMPGQTWANCHEWLEKQAWMKMYLLFNMVIFHCDVSFMEGIVYGDSRSSKCNVILVVTVCHCYREGAIYTQSLPMEEIYFDMIDVNVRLLSLEVFAERKAVADVFFLNRDLSNHYILTLDSGLWIFLSYCFGSETFLSSPKSSVNKSHFHLILHQRFPFLFNHIRAVLWGKHNKKQTKKQPPS